MCSYTSQERDYYASKAKKAIDNPKSFTSIVIDGMDQSKTYIPKPETITKDHDMTKRIQAHITAVKVCNFY